MLDEENTELLKGVRHTNGGGGDGDRMRVRGLCDGIACEVMQLPKDEECWNCNWSFEHRVRSG